MKTTLYTFGGLIALILATLIKPDGFYSTAFHQTGFFFIGVYMGFGIVYLSKIFNP